MVCPNAAEPWKFTKKQALRGKHYADFATFCGAIDDCLNRVQTILRAAWNEGIVSGRAATARERRACPAPLRSRLANNASIWAARSINTLRLLPRT